MGEPDTFRVSVDGSALEGSRVELHFELTMTRFTAPDLGVLVDALERTRTRRRGRAGMPIAVELAPDDLRVLLGSLYTLHADLVAAPLALSVTWCGLELRTNGRMGRERFMPVFQCDECAGKGRIFRAALGREEPCMRCRQTGEIRGF